MTSGQVALNTVSPRARLVLDRVRHTMGREDHRGAVRHVAQLLDKDRAEPAQPVDHVAVVHHLVPHVHRRTEQLQRTLDDVDGAIDPGTEAARVGEQYLHQIFGLPALRLSRQASSSSSTAPIVIAESAMLNAGK